MKVDFNKIGEKIAKERLKRNLTQDELAEKLKITPAFLSNIETGKRKMSIDTLIVIAKELDLSLDYLILDDYLDEDTEYKFFIKQIYKQIENLDEKTRQNFLDIAQYISSKL